MIPSWAWAFIRPLAFFTAVIGSVEMWTDPDMNLGLALLAGAALSVFDYSARKL